MTYQVNVLQLYRLTWATRNSDEPRYDIDTGELDNDVIVERQCTGRSRDAELAVDAPSVVIGNCTSSTNSKSGMVDLTFIIHIVGNMGELANKYNTSICL